MSPAKALVFMAAGNTDGLVNMSQFSNLIFVSGTDQNNQRWNDGQTGNTHGSSYGPYIDLAAPAANPIFVADPGSPSGYGVGDGTSFAAPLAAGVAGLIWSINPNLTPDQVKNILYTTADDLGPPGWDETYGYGLVDAGAAVQAALLTVPEPHTITLVAMGAVGLCLLVRRGRRND